MHVHTHLQEEFCDFKVAIGAGVVERDETSFVLGMDVRTMLE